MTMHVLDVSNHQNGMTLSGYDGYIFKATEGIYYIDNFCDGYVNQAKKLNKPWGVYHFLDGSDVIKQAQFFYNNTKGYIGKGVMVLDYEMYGRQGSAKVEQFCKEFYRLSGVNVILYMNESDSNNDTWSDYLKKNNGLWIAKYSAIEPVHTKGLSIIGWQYTSTPLDKSWFYMDSNTWLKYAKSTKDNQTQEPSKPATIDNYLTTGTQFKAKENLPIKSNDDFSKFTGMFITKGQVFDIEKIINTGSTTHAKLKNNLGLVTLHKNYVEKIK